MYREIQAKTLIGTYSGEDKTFGIKYNLNLYRGCEHQCIYCDSRSLCYGIEDFRDVLVKVNALELLESELSRKRRRGVIGFGSMSDPYGPVERRYGLTGQALKIIARRAFPAHMLTKSDLVLNDIDTFAEINRVHAAVIFSISTPHDDLSRKLEPGAPRTSARLAAMQTLAARGIPVGIAMMPILPFLEDNWEDIQAIIDLVAAHGGSFIIPWFGMSLRDRQREHYYAALDRLFPGVRAKYEQTFGERYAAPARNAKKLQVAFEAACKKKGLETHAPLWSEPKQLELF